MGALPKEILGCFGAITRRKIGKVNQSDCPCDGIYIKAPKPWIKRKKELKNPNRTNG